MLALVLIRGVAQLVRAEGELARMAAALSNPKESLCAARWKYLPDLSRISNTLV